MSNWTGRKHKESSKKKMRLAKLGKPGPWRGKNRPTGEKSAHWSGNKVGYSGLHDWVRKWKGTPMTCEMIILGFASRAINYLIPIRDKYDCKIFQPSEGL